MPSLVAFLLVTPSGVYADAPAPDFADQEQLAFIAACVQTLRHESTGQGIVSTFVSNIDRYLTMCGASKSQTEKFHAAIYGGKVLGNPSPQMCKDFFRVLSNYFSSADVQC